MVHSDGAEMGSLILPRQHRAASQQQHQHLHRHKRQEDADSSGVTEVIQTISVVQQIDVDSNGSTFSTVLTPVPTSTGSSSPALTTTPALSDATTSAVLSSDTLASSTTQSSLSTSQSAVLTSTPSASIPTTSFFASFSVSSNTTSLISTSTTGSSSQTLLSSSNSTSTATTATSLTSSSSISTSGSSSSFTYLISSSSSFTSSFESSSTITSYSSSSSSAAYSTSSGSSGFLVGGGSATTSVADATSSSAAATSSSASSSNDSTPATTTPVIIGSVVSSLAGAAFIIVAIIFIWRWKKRSGQMLPLGSAAPRAIADSPRSGSAGIGPAAAELDAAPTLQPSDTGLTTRSSFAYAFPAALATLTQKYGKRASHRTEGTVSSTAGSERGFYRVSGRKLPSVLQHGGDGYGEPDMAELDGRGTMMSGTSFYRDSQGFYGGPGSPALPPPGAASTSSQRDSGVPVMRPSPARTPVTEKGFFMGGPSLAPPTPDQDPLGRSHNDGSHTSRFTEEV